jgi:predicted amidohydrolase YtcJ
MPLPYNPGDGLLGGPGKIIERTPQVMHARFSPSASQPILFHNCTVLTMSSNLGNATAVAILGERIMAVGTEEEVRAVIGPAVEIDLGGRTVIPGLIDAHTHLELSAYARHQWHDVSSLETDGVLARVEELVPGVASSEYLVLQGSFGQALPTRQELDRVAPRTPVVMRSSMHRAVANSAALSKGGVHRHTLSPIGARIHRDSYGEPNGLIEEGWDLLGWSPDPSFPLSEQLAETGEQLFARFGVTTICEVPASRDAIHSYQHLAARGELPFRINLAPTVAPGHQPLLTGETISTAPEDLLGQFAGQPEWVSVNAVKIFLDGGRHAAYSSDSVKRPATEWGLVTRTLESLTSEVMEAAQAGLQVWIHAIGDLAQEMAVTVLETVAAIHPCRQGWARVEHLGNHNASMSVLQRLLNVGAIAVPNPTFIYAEPETGPRGSVTAETYIFRTLRNLGHRPPGNSDTAGTQPFAANPWFGMSCMVRRTNKLGSPVSSNQSITIMDALKSYTIDAAAAAGREDDLGSLEKGKLADFAVLSRNPLSCREDEIAGITSLQTVVGGQITFADRGSLTAPNMPASSSK